MLFDRSLRVTVNNTSQQSRPSMTASLMFERTNNPSCAFPFDKTSAACDKPYYKFYQLELRQLLLEDRSQHKEKSDATENKRLVMERQRERTKPPTRTFDHEKTSTTKELPSITTLSSNIPNNNTAPSKSKSTSKQKQSSSSTKHHGSRQRKAPVKPLTHFPTITIDDDTDDNLSFVNERSYTQALSSSRDQSHENDQLARQAFLKTLMSHYDTCVPPDLSRWNFCRDFHHKICESTSPTVYRKFERIVL